MECDESFTRLNFQPISYINSQNKEQPEYLMTRLGFSVLTMGFTGAKELKWKIKYTETFDFEKEHKHVMESIRALECDTDFTGPNFRLISHIDSMNRENPEYLMTRLGFSVLTMGFIGAKARARLRFSKSASLDGRDAPLL